jgi:hypothetical protein
MAMDAIDQKWSNGEREIMNATYCVDLRPTIKEVAIWAEASFGSSTS